MKRILLLSILQLVILSVSSLKAQTQTPRSITGTTEQGCGFIDQGYSISDENKNNFGQVSLFTVNGKYYYNNNKSNFVKKVYSDVKKNNNIKKDLTLGYVYDNKPITIGGVSMENSYWLHGFQVLSLQLYELKSDGGLVSVSFSSASITSGKKGDEEYRGINGVFTAEPNKTYMIYYRYKVLENRKGSDKSAVQTAYMYLCVSGRGGVHDWFSKEYSIKADAVQTCGYTTVSINKYRADYTYYWSETKGAVSKTPEFLIPPEGLNFKESKTIFIHGFQGTYQAVPTTVNIKVLNKPEIPTYTGNKLLCDCAVEFSGTPGAGGNSIRWKYKKAFGFFNINIPSILTSLDGVNSDGTYVGLTGVNEAKIKSTKQISLATYLNENGVECRSEFIDVTYETIPCTDCSSNFLLGKGKKYVFSAWAKEGNNLYDENYLAPVISITFTWSGGSKVYNLSPSGNIIDGWQKIEEVFIVPPKTEQLQIKLDCNSAQHDCFFDDIRIHPFEASMVSYVYDPHTLQLSAELDNNNMYIKYVYDEQGILTSSKIETLDGVRTVSESRTNIQVK